MEHYVLQPVDTGNRRKQYLVYLVRHFHVTTARGTQQISYHHPSAKHRAFVCIRDISIEVSRAWSQARFLILRFACTCGREGFTQRLLFNADAGGKAGMGSWLGARRNQNCVRTAAMRGAVVERGGSSFQAVLDTTVDLGAGGEAVGGRLERERGGSVGAQA